MGDLFGLQGRVSIVTGGNGGIGKGIADGLAMQGCKIVIAARNEEKTAEAVADIRSRFKVEALGVSLDLLDAASIGSVVEQVLDKYGRIDVLVNNAGVSVRKAPEDYTSDDWDLVMDTNLKGAFMCCQAVYPVMKKQGKGKIINIGSIASLYGVGRTVAYGCSKMGLLSLTYSLALAWAKDSIFVNCILPGWIETPLSITARQAFKGLSEFVEERTPMGRWGRPEDFMGAAVYLASDASDFVTGEYLRVDGGFAQHGNTVRF